MVSWPSADPPTDRPTRELRQRRRGVAARRQHEDQRRRGPAVRVARGQVKGGRLHEGAPQAGVNQKLGGWKDPVQAQAPGGSGGGCAGKDDMV